MAANPGGATTAAIADAAGISRTAAREALTGLETAGAAQRTKGGRAGIPDTWRPAAPASLAPDAAAPSGSGEPADAAGDPAGADLASVDEPAAQPGTGDGEPGPDDPAGQDAADGAKPAAAAPAEVGDDHQAGDSDAGDSAKAPPDPAVTAEIAGHVGQIQSAASAIAIVLQGGNLQAALAGIEEICEQAGQARRTLKAAARGKKTPAARPGGLREKVAAHLHDHPSQALGPAARPRPRLRPRLRHDHRPRKAGDHRHRPRPRWRPARPAADRRHPPPVQGHCAGATRTCPPGHSPRPRPWRSATGSAPAARGTQAALTRAREPAMTEITVSIWHNVARDPAGRHTAALDGFTPGDPMVCVFTYQAPADGRLPEAIAEDALAAYAGVDLVHVES